MIEGLVVCMKIVAICQRVQENFERVELEECAVDTLTEGTAERDTLCRIDKGTIWARMPIEERREGMSSKEKENTTKSQP
jgi:hypothetical protein